MRKRGHNSQGLPAYDPVQALGLAGGISSIRDLVVEGVLEKFGDRGELAALFDVSVYERDPGNMRELAHRGVGLAKQGAMPALTEICRQLSDALDNGEIARAKELGEGLRPVVESARAAVDVESQETPH